MYKSTRGKDTVSSAEAILNGLANDGGLYVIDKLPKIDYNDLLNLDYPTMASKILKAFFPEFSYDDILYEVKDAYKSFDTANVVEIKKCEDTFFLELFHGPTLAFKDLALVVLPRLMKLSRRIVNTNKNITILTATSGDTGGAALNGFKGVDGTNIIVLYPNNGVSRVQEAQMHSFKDSNAMVYAVNANFDYCQSFVKKFFNEHKDLSLSSANSINIGRLVPQIAYYFYSYIYLVNNGHIKNGEKINFSVPTGNFGDIFAGFMAKSLGLPINTLICASNKNDVLTDYFNDGIYNKNREFFKTNSPSMDILVSSNLERLLYYSLGSNEKEVKKLMNDLNNKGTFTHKCKFSCFYASRANEDETLNAIKDAYNKYNYLIDPHTAVAYKCYKDYKKEKPDNLKTVIVSTASPFKFPNAIRDAFSLEDDILENIAKSFSLSVPKALKYDDYDKEIIEKDDLDSLLTGVIKCLE